MLTERLIDGMPWSRVVCSGDCARSSALLPWKMNEDLRPHEINGSFANTADGI